MKLEIGNNQGWVILDDNTGKIMSVLITNGVEGKPDARHFTSYTNHPDGTHTSLREAPNWDEEESNRRMNIIGQNGNTGEHYD